MKAYLMHAGRDLDVEHVLPATADDVVVSDFGTAAAPSILFSKPNLWIIPFLAVSAPIFGLPRLAPPFFRRYGHRVLVELAMLTPGPLRARRRTVVGRLSGDAREVARARGAPRRDQSSPPPGPSEPPLAAAVRRGLRRHQHARRLRLR
ncbi:MAG: hypothetical protein M3292_06760, partial [Actinomycetota bacterium]|nr:hypothetical protein [Actinomycetota bacterium]